MTSNRRIPWLFCEALAVWSAAVSFLQTTGARHDCNAAMCKDREEEKLTCPPGSLILVRNVTSVRGVAQLTLLKGLKRTCMGQTVCPTSLVCSGSREASEVTFLCVPENRIEDNSCTQTVIRLSSHEGFIQSPGYPAAVENQKCHWSITLDDPRRAVHLFLHDLSFSQRTHSACDSSLRVWSYACDGSRSRYPRMLCANESSLESGDNASSVLVSCGAVDLQMIPGRPPHQLRFWLSYTVTNRLVSEATSIALSQAGLVVPCGDKTATVHKELLPTSKPEMNTTGNSTVTFGSGVSTEGTEQDREVTLLHVLIVLVAVFGIITLTLSSILIAVCIRRRRPRLIEHVYAVPSTCEGNSLLTDGLYRRTASVVRVPPRPQLHEHYSDVADAVSSNHRRDVLPGSPGYAEVEPPRDSDVPQSSSSRLRFQFRPRQRSATPSMSSTTYEDVSPCVITPSTTTASTSSPTNTQTEVTPGRRKSQTPVQGNATDSIAQKDVKPRDKDGNMNDKGKPLAQTPVTTIVNPSPTAGLKGQNRPNNQRLYPLQEGRVASLISTLNRNKDQPTKHGPKGEQ